MIRNKAKVIVPVMAAIAVAAAALPSCSSTEGVPAPVPRPVPASATPFPTLESALAESVAPDPTHRFLVIYSAGGKKVWGSPVGKGMENYSAWVSGGKVRLTEHDFRVMGAFVERGPDGSKNHVIAFGQDGGGYAPSKISVIDKLTGIEVQQYWHLGHIKDALPLYDVDTPEGRKDVLVVAALSNIPAIKRDEPYAPVLYVADRTTMGRVIAYYQVAPSGQVSELKAEDGKGVSFRFDQDPDGARRTIRLEELFSPLARKNARDFQMFFH